MSDFHNHLARQHAISRVNFGPGERTNGVIDHITQEFEEIKAADGTEGRAKEWTDVAILGMDGLLRACRAHIEANPDDFPSEDPDTGRPYFINGVPTNDAVALLAFELITQKQQKNELRDWGDWRAKDPEKAINHTAGIHD